MFHVYREYNIIKDFNAFAFAMFECAHIYLHVYKYNRYIVGGFLKFDPHAHSFRLIPLISHRALPYNFLLSV